MSSFFLPWFVSSRTNIVAVAMVRVFTNHLRHRPHLHHPPLFFSTLRKPFFPFRNRYSWT